VKNFDKFQTLVESHFGDSIDVNHLSHEDLVVIYQFIGKEKQRILFTESFNSYFNNPAYTSLVLVEGVVRMMLREIAPKRKKVKKKNVG